VAANEAGGRYKARALDVSLPALQQRPLATLAAAGTYADARGSCLGFEQVTAPGPMPPTLQPHQMVRKWGLP